jgi:WD40 repeat protein
MAEPSSSDPPAPRVPDVAGQGKTAGPAWSFDVFLSYATDPDYRFARELEAFLESFHRLRLPSGERLPAIRVCRDGSDFRRIGSVDDTLVAHLGQSRLLLVLCSSGAARSSMVDLELDWFLQHRGSESVLLAVTDGADPITRPEDVFSKRIIGQGLHRRPWYDFRGRSLSKGTSAVKLRDYEDARLALAAHLVGRIAGEIQPVWYRNRRRVRRRAGAVALGAMALISGLAVSLRVADTRRAAETERARREHLISQARGNPDPTITTLLLSQLPPTPETPGAMAVALDRLAEPVPIAATRFAAPIQSLSFSATGERLLVIARGEATVLPSNGSSKPVPLFHPQKVISGEFSPTADSILTVDAKGSVRLWNSSGALSLSLLDGNDRRAGDASFSPNGRQVAVGLEDGQVTVWSVSRDGAGLRDSAPQRLLLGHTAAVNLVRWSRDSGRLFTASADGTGRIWALSDGHAMILRRPNKFIDGTFNFDGSLMVTIQDDAAAELWMTNDPRQPTTILGEKGEVIGAAFSPIANTLVTLSPSKAPRLWEVGPGGRARNTFSMSGHEGIVSSVRFGADGRAILTAANDGTAIIREPGVGMTIFRQHRRNLPDSDLRAAELSADGSLMATGAADGSVEIWATQLFSRAMTIDSAARRRGPGQLDTISAFDLETQIDPTGRRVLLVAGGQAKLWLRDDSQARAVPSEGPVRTARFSAKGDRMLVVSERNTAVWDLSTGLALTSVRHHSPPSRGDLAFDGGRFLTVEGDRALIWNTSSGTDPKDATVLLHPDAIGSAVFSPNGQSVLLGSKGHVRVWGLGTHPDDPLLSYDGPVDAVRYAPDGKWLLVTAGSDAHLLEVGTRNDRRLTHGAPISDARFSRSGTTLLLTGGRLATVWRGDGAKELQRITLDHPIRHGALSPDGERLTLLDGESSVLRVWATHGGAPIELKGHDKAILDAVFTGDGTRAISGAMDHTARIWPLAGGDPVVLPLDAAPTRLQLSDDDQYLLVNDLASATFMVVGWQTVRQLLIDRTTLCLTSVQRTQYLAESPSTADRAWRSCEAKHGR